MMLFHRKPDGKVQRLERKVLDLAAQLEAKDRIIAILETERDTLTSVVARDRARVSAESAVYARRQAEAEGNSNAEFNRESFGGSS